MSKRKDLTKQVFNRLEVLEFAGLNKYSRATWRCRCRCGVELVVDGKSLRSNNSKSCGCLQREAIRETALKNRKHGMRNTKEYAAWRGMLDRCYNPKADSYPEYGGRGIKVHKTWRNSFPNFYRDMGPCPPGYRMSIDRIKGHLGYSPTNCRWATPKEQNRNRPSFNRMLTFYGKTLCVTAWAEELGWPKTAIQSRVAAGWPTKRVLTEPLRRQKNRKSPLPSNA